MFRTWPLLLLLIAAGCSKATQDVTDTPAAAGDEAADASPVPGASDAEPVSIRQPDADEDAPVAAAPAAQSADINQLFADFIESPDGPSYLAVRLQVLVSDSYEPYSDEFTAAEELLDLYNLDEARDALQDTLPNLLLSPRAHRLLAEIESAAGDVQAADRERRIATACVEGLLGTGDGSEDAPYRVLRPSDEYDVLAELGKRPEMQSLVLRDDRHLDQFTCTDGSEVWFDITDAFGQLGKSLGQ